MPTVEIKGYGTRVEFPDTMTDAEIEAALRDKVMPQLKAETAASDRQALEAMTPYERAQVLERHRNGGAQTVGEAMTQLSGAAPAVSPPAGALTSTPEGAAPGSRSFGQAVRDTGHNALVALGEPARGRLSLPGLQVALRGLSTMPMPGANPAAMLSAYDRAAAAVLPEDVRPAPEGAGAWERALTETALPGLAAFADPVNMGAMVAGGALAAPVAGALGLGGVMASPIASAASKGAARALQAGLQNAGALGAFGGVEAAQRGEGLGGIASAAGRSAALGLALGPAGSAPGGVAGKLLTEVGVLGLAGPAMEGRMPTEDDVVGAAVMIGGLNAARGLSPAAIRGLLKRREERTPEETQAVEEIPAERMEAIVQEIKLLPEVAESQRGSGPPPILMGERGPDARYRGWGQIGHEVQEGEMPGTGKPGTIKRKSIPQMSDGELLAELAKSGHTDRARSIMEKELDRRTAPAGEPPATRPLTTAAQVKTPEEIQAARLGENAPPEVPISPKTEAVPRETPAEPVPGKKLPTGFVYHNTRGSELDAIAQEGMTAGSFSKRPIDFGGDSWIAVRRDDISGSIQEHPYGAEVALEPTWGEAAPGYSQTMPIPPDRLYLVDRNGRLIRKLSEPAPVEPTPAAEAPALPVAASEAPKPGKVPAPAAEGPQGAKEPWEMTREEFGVPPEPKDTEVLRYKATERIARERPEDMTPEMQALLDKTKAQQREHAKYLRAHKAYLPKSNEHFLAVRAAVEAGKLVPPEVLKDYPDLAARAETPPAPAQAVPSYPDRLREQAGGLFRRAEALEEHSRRRFDSAPGAAITGGSGRHRSGLHRKTDRAIEGSLNDLQEAKRLRERAATLKARADNNDPVILAERAKERESRDAVREAVAAKESAERKAAPILNEDTPGALRLTKAEWAKEHSDYKNITIRDGARVRTLVRGGALQDVFLTDAPVKMRQPAQAPEAKPAAEGKRAKKPALPESSAAGFLNLEAFGQLQPDRSVKRTKAKGSRGIHDASEGLLAPVSSRLRRIHVDTERRVRGLMHEVGTATIAARDTAKGLQEGLLKMAREDPDAYTALEVALGQGDSARIAQMIERAGLQKQYQAVREYLDATRERMLDAGIEVGEVPGEYFPRRVRDYAGLMDHLGSEAAGEIGKQLKARADKLGVPVDALPPEIRDQIVNSYLRGRIPPGEGKPGMTKPRTIDNFTEDLLPFYYRPEEALAKYISTAEEAIARARFFGKGEDVTGSIGSYVADLIARGEIKPSQEREVKNALLSLFNRNPSWQFIRDTKNVTYAMTMGSTASAVTQVGDLAWSLYENGAYQTAKQAGKSILRKQGLSKRDIGIQDIASEFDSLGKSGKALDTLFKLTGLEQMDALGKETLINGSLARARKQAKRIAAGKKDYAARRFQRDLDRYFGSEQEQILKDLASGETTEPVKFFLFNKLLDYQPVARSEMPQFYLEHPNMRIGYQLKSFTLKQMDAFRRESFDLIRDGARKGDRQMQIDGMRNLVRLGSFFVLANASADVIKDVMFGRGLPKADDLMWDNVLRLFGFSRYLTWRVRREGLGTAAAQFVGGPIVGKLDDAWKDGVRIHRGLTKSEYEVEWDKLRLLNSFPLAGAWYFWYKGQGADWIKEDAVKEAKENAPGVRPSRSSRPTRPTRQGR